MKAFALLTVHIAQYNYRVEFIYSKEDASVIFRDAKAHNLTTSGHVWIVTEQALHANNTPYGVLGLELNFATSENEHIRVSKLLLLVVCKFAFFLCLLYSINRIASTYLLLPSKK